MTLGPEDFSPGNTPGNSISPERDAELMLFAARIGDMARANATVLDLSPPRPPARRMSMQILKVLAFAAAFGLIAVGASTTAMAQAAGKPMTTPSGLQITDSKVGTGATPKTGQTCVMHYTGWLYVNGAKGQKFDSSVDRGQPFEFPIGVRRVIAGWDEGVATHEGRRQAHPHHPA